MGRLKPHPLWKADSLRSDCLSLTGGYCCAGCGRFSSRTGGGIHGIRSAKHFCYTFSTYVLLNRCCHRLNYRNASIYRILSGSSFQGGSFCFGFRFFLGFPLCLSCFFRTLFKAISCFR